MQNNTAEPMDASQQFCPNVACSARGQIGQGNIRIHDRKRQRYRCQTCRQTFSARRGTMLEGLRKPTELMVIVVWLTSLWLSHPGDCPRVRVRRTNGGKPGVIEPESIASNGIKLWCHKD